MWSSQLSITVYKGRKSSDVGMPVSLADEFNMFYARFEMNNTCSAVRLSVDQNSYTIVLSVPDVFKTVKPCKAPGPDGIHGWVLRVSAT